MTEPVTRLQGGMATIYLAEDLKHHRKVMPFVEGETLRDRLARVGELPVPDAVRLLGEIAEALATAHRGGVVHRDIKPENVLLSGRGS